MLIGVGVSCRILYSADGYLYLSSSGLITSVGKKNYFSAIVYLKLCVFVLFGGPLSLCDLDRLRYFIVSLPGPSI